MGTVNTAVMMHLATFRVTSFTPHPCLTVPILFPQQPLRTTYQEFVTSPPTTHTPPQLTLPWMGCKAEAQRAQEPIQVT
jgi:hypothetical protein